MIMKFLLQLCHLEPRHVIECRQRGTQDCEVGRLLAGPYSQMLELQRPAFQGQLCFTFLTLKMGHGIPAEDFSQWKRQDFWNAQHSGWNLAVTQYVAGATGGEWGDSGVATHASWEMHQPSRWDAQLNTLQLCDLGQVANYSKSAFLSWSNEGKVDVQVTHSHNT